MAVADESGGQFDKLIQAEHRIKGDGMQMPYKRADAAQRQYDAPHDDGVAQKTEFGVAAGAEYAADDRGVQRFSDTVIRAYIKHPIQIAPGRIVQIHQMEYQRLDEQNGGACQDAEQQRIQRDAVAGFFCEFPVAGAQVLPDQYGAAAGYAAAEDDGQVFDDGCDGVCRHHICAHMPDDGGRRGQAAAPNDVVGLDRRCVLQKIVPQAACYAVVHRKLKPDAPARRGMGRAASELDEARADGGNGDAGNGLFRHAGEKDEDAQRIKRHVQNQARRADQGAQARVLHAFDHAEINLRKAHGEIRERDRPEKCRAIPDQHPVICKDAHQHLRETQ